MKLKLPNLLSCVLIGFSLIFTFGCGDSSSDDDNKDSPPPEESADVAGLSGTESGPTVVEGEGRY